MNLVVRAARDEDADQMAAILNEIEAALNERGIGV